MVCLPPHQHMFDSLESPLVRHLMTSWRPEWQQSLSDPRIVRFLCTVTRFPYPFLLWSQFHTMSYVWNLLGSLYRPSPCSYSSFCVFWFSVFIRLPYSAQIKKLFPAGRTRGPRGGSDINWSRYPWSESFCTFADKGYEVLGRLGYTLLRQNVVWNLRQILKTSCHLFIPESDNVSLVYL